MQVLEQILLYMNIFMNDTEIMQCILSGYWSEDCDPITSNIIYSKLTENIG